MFLLHALSETKLSLPTGSNTPESDTRRGLTLVFDQRRAVVAGEPAKYTFETGVHWDTLWVPHETIDVQERRHRRCANATSGAVPSEDRRDSEPFR